VADWNLPTLRAEVHATSGPQRDPEREPELDDLPAVTP